ncbi:MAG: Bax inhibitor-1 family protein [Planctomycetota bacterium]
MRNQNMAISGPADAIAFAPSEARAEFIRKTYTQLLLAIAAFILLATALVNSPFAEGLIAKMMGGRFSWLIVLGLFMFVSHIANKWALSATSPGKQYLGLYLFVVAESIIFLPLLYIATLPQFAAQNVLMNAAIITLGTFSGLTAIVFLSGKDFSLMGGILKVAGFVALGVIVCSLIFGFSLGIIFCGAMALFAAGSVLYTTSNVLHQYRPGMHVAAALALFAGIALLFWYILRIVMSFTGRD